MLDDIQKTLWATADKLRANMDAPPQLHVKYGEYKAVVGIQRLAVAESKLPRRATDLVLDWAKRQRNERMKDWDLCQSLQ